MENTSITSVTNGQEKSYKRLVEDSTQKGIKLVLGKQFLNKDGMQALLSRGNEVSAAVVDAIIETSKKFGNMSNRYPNQKVTSSYGYPPTYKGFLPIEEQIQLVAKRHNLNPDKASAYAQTLRAITLPSKSEGLIAMPWWNAIAPTYGEAIQILCNLLAQSRSFQNYREGKLSNAHVRLFENTKQVFEAMRKAQGSDILVFPAQAGLGHKGESILYARDEFLLSGYGEFGGDPIMGFTILLNHPGRMSQFEEVDMDFPGVEYAPVGDSVFSRSLCLRFGVGGVRFAFRYLDIPRDFYGSVSGFFPAVIED